MLQNSCVTRELVSMKESTTDYLTILHRQYMTEVGRFLTALKENAPRNELLLIRTNVKKLLAEIRRFPLPGRDNK
jgi:hypothetical protein